MSIDHMMSTGQVDITQLIRQACLSQSYVFFTGFERLVCRSISWSVLRSHQQIRHHHFWSYSFPLDFEQLMSLGAGNYHQPQLPSANMADSVVGTERYSLFMQKLSTHFGVWGLYMTEYHVCTYCTPPFDLRVATFAARRWGEKRQADGNLQFSKQRMMVIAPLLWW